MFAVHLFAIHDVKLIFVASQLSFATAVVAEETEGDGGTRRPPTFEEMMNKVLEIEGDGEEEDDHVFPPKAPSSQHKAGGNNPMDAHAAAMEAAAAKADARLKMLREEKRRAEEEEAARFEEEERLAEEAEAQARAKAAAERKKMERKQQEEAEAAAAATAAAEALRPKRPVEPYFSTLPVRELRGLSFLMKRRNTRTRFEKVFFSHHFSYFHIISPFFRCSPGHYLKPTAPCANL